MDGSITAHCSTQSANGFVIANSRLQNGHLGSQTGKHRNSLVRLTP